jgi:hypothetical protein
MSSDPIFDPFDVEEDDQWEEFNGSGAFSSLRVQNDRSPVQVPVPVQQRLKPPENIHIVASFQEDITCLCDSLSDSQYSVSVEGVVTTHFAAPLDNKSLTPFYLALKDPNNHLDNVSHLSEFSNEIINESNLMQPEKERLFRVTIPPALVGDPTQIIKYTCTRNLRPIPLVSILLVRETVKMSLALILIFIFFLIENAS